MDMKRRGVIAARLQASSNCLDLQAKPIWLKTRSTLFIVMALQFARLTALGQRPANDDFINSTRLAGNSLTVTGVVDGATRELREFYWFTAFQDWPATVWWSWTPTDTAPVTIEVVDLSTNVLKLGGVNVFGGIDWSFDLFRSGFVGSLPFDSGRRPYLSFVPTPGASYHIQGMGPSGSFTLRLRATNAPVFIIQPKTQSASLGGSIFFGVGVAGIAPFHYQWQFNGTNLEGETGAILSLDGITQTQSGQYAALVWNSTGTNLSDAADLLVSSTNVHPSLSLASLPPGTGYALSLTGEPGRSYRIETSTNMVDWVPEKSFPGSFIFYRYSASVRRENGMVFNTNTSTTFALPPASSASKFFRALRYSPPNDVCINNLKQLRFASELWALEKKHNSSETPVTTDIDPYFRNGAPRHCPLGVNIWAGGLRADPYCQTPSHLAVEPDY